MKPIALLQNRVHQEEMTTVYVALFAMLLLGLVRGLTIMPPTTKTAEHLPLAKQAMDYFDKSSDPFAAVQTSIDMLVKAGFQEIVGPYRGQITPGRFGTFSRHCCRVFLRSTIQHSKTSHCSHKFLFLFSFKKGGSITLHATSRLLVRKHLKY